MPATRYPGTRYQVSHKHTHSDRLERWLGKDACERVSESMRHWYGPPIAVAGVPGDVFACKGGEFVGGIDAGQECSWLDALATKWKRWKLYHAVEGRYSPAQVNAFASLSQLVHAAVGGHAQRLPFAKTGGAAALVGRSSDCWTSGISPGAGGAAAPGGTATTNTTTGNWGWKPPVNADTGRVLRCNVSANAPCTLLLIDQLFRVQKTMLSTATEAVTGTFARYQSGTPTDEDYIGGNFCFPATLNVGLGGTAYDWTDCQYTDQDSNTAQSFPSVAGLASLAPRHIAIAGRWFLSLAAADVGVKALTQMQCSASISGSIDFVVAHPLLLVPIPAAVVPVVSDGLYTAANFTRVYNNACLSGLFLQQPTAINPLIAYGVVDVVAEA